MNGQIITEKNIEISIHAGAGLWNISADPTRIDQIIMNLAVNARDAMPKGGKLIIATENVVPDRAFERVHPGALTGEHVRLCVYDTGSGITDEVKEHIFEPFYTT